METFTHTAGGIRFSLQADPALRMPAQMLLRSLESVPADEMKDGYMFEAGFSVFTCMAAEDGYQILSPDYADSPLINTTQDLSAALWVLLEQALLLKKCGIGGEPTRFDDEIVVAEGALESPLISLQRYSDLGGSGWCVEALAVEDGVCQTVSAPYSTIYAYELFAKRPALLRVLSLPREYFVVFEENSIADILNEKNESLLT